MTTIPNKFANQNIARYIPPSRGSDFQTFSGSDMQVIAYFPILEANNPAVRRYKIFAEIQTISISSTRSIAPVRVLGSSSPITYTRGARSFAGTMVFATINEDPFNSVFSVAASESMLASSTSLSSDQLPPFNIVIVGANEKGGAAMHVLNGITLVNYGTTYSIDDMYTETTYSYVAADCTTLRSLSMSQKQRPTAVDLVKEGISALSSTEAGSSFLGKVNKSLSTLSEEKNKIYTNLVEDTNRRRAAKLARDRELGFEQ
jgi:hypothetical protein